ncbi:TetR/AcrR family transcriptional regulator [Streptomyces sp. NPDC048142]|uniref:TetR/AcrR family transcriptional regulator n=1 Tax=Streptomyces sp. NPDC048142 TaxID=3365501 RepID=UPI0037160F60
MDQPVSLRERKKDQTRRLLMTTALDLFEQRGFDQVSVAEVAAASSVSKKTVFNYFACKEDLILGAGKRHIDEPACAVRERPPGQTPHGAMREYLLTALAERQPMTGLSASPYVRRLQKLIADTPALTARNLYYQQQSRSLLAEVLAEEGASEVSASLIAAQILAVQEVLAVQNARRVITGESPDSVYSDAVAATQHAFHLLERGLGDLLRRPHTISTSTDND